MKRPKKPNGTRKKIDNVASPALKQQLADNVLYECKPTHKPPFTGDSVCPKGITDEDALQMLKLGIKMGTFSPLYNGFQHRGLQFPKTVWYYSEHFQEYFQALYTHQSFYHGFPVSEHEVPPSIVKAHESA